MYSENYPKKLDCVNIDPKITLKRLYYIQKLSKISKVNEIWNIVPRITFYIISVIIFKNFNWPKIACQKRINCCRTLVGMFWDVIYYVYLITSIDKIWNLRFYICANFGKEASISIFVKLRFHPKATDQITQPPSAFA